jgi:hypothetical protein
MLRIISHRPRPHVVGGSALRGEERVFAGRSGFGTGGEAQRTQISHGFSQRIAFPTDVPKPCSPNPCVLALRALALRVFAGGESVKRGAVLTHRPGQTSENLVISAGSACRLHGKYRHCMSWIQPHDEACGRKLFEACSARSSIGKGCYKRRAIDGTQFSQQPNTALTVAVLD